MVNKTDVDGQGEQRKKNRYMGLYFETAPHLIYILAQFMLGHTVAQSVIAPNQRWHFLSFLSISLSLDTLMSVAYRRKKRLVV